MPQEPDHIKTMLKELRREKGITQEELAVKLKMTRQSIISIEKGECTPSLCHAIKIAKFFGKKVEEVFLYKD